MNTIKIEKKNTKMVAHRGLSGIEKENTNAAFIAAGNRSYFGIETDVHRTLDGQFVVIHDEFTGRVAIDNIEIENSTFDTIRRITLADTDGKKGREDLHIPTLKEYINTCKRYEKKAVLELKSDFTDDEVKRICDEIIECDYLNEVIFISFNYENLVKLRKIYPDHPAQFLTGEYSRELLDKLIKDKFDLDIDFNALNKEIVKEIKDAGLLLNAWTVDSKEVAENLIDWGIDFITSNILE